MISLGPFCKQWVGIKVAKRKKKKVKSQILVFLKEKGKNGIHKREKNQKCCFTKDRKKMPKDQREIYI